MDRARGNRPARRRTQPAFSSSFESTDTAFSADHIQVRSPTLPFASSTTPQTAPQARRGNRQSTTPATQPSGPAGSSPTTGKAKSVRKRSRLFGFDGGADDDAPAEEAPTNNKKGTHNLRRRPKIDYSAQDFEDEVPEIALAAPRTATRKKRDGSETFADDMTPTAQRGRRAASKTPARRSEHHYPSYQPPSDDDVVKDTIEVIGDSSDLHGSDEFSDHESKVESPAAEAKQSSIAAQENNELSTPSPLKPEPPAEPQPDQPNQPDQPDKEDVQESTALPSPSTSVKAVNGETANYVSIISPERQADEPASIIKSSPLRKSIVSSPTALPAAAPPSGPTVSSPIPFRFVEQRPSTPTPEAEAPPSFVVTLKLPRPKPPPQLPVEEPEQTTEEKPTADDAVAIEAEDDEKPEAMQVDQEVEPSAEVDISQEVTRDAGEEAEADDQAVADDEADADEAETDDEDEDEDEPPQFPWAHLGPYLPSEYVLHPEPTAIGGGQAGEEAEDDEAEEPEEEDADGEKDDEVNGTGSDMPRDTTSTPQTPRRGTPAPSALTGANTPVPSERAVGPKVPGVRRRKQYKFRKLRDPADFQEYLKNAKDMPTDELYALLELGANTLVAWQSEWQACGRDVDDFENAKRRAQQDAEYEKKTADLDQFLRIESYIEKDFELRGYRATLKDKDEGVQRARWQDRVMAAAYGFEYDPHVSKVGQQDPLAQRDGVMAGRQLRSQPQQTAKAAEAGEGGDGLVVVGKRTRNPPKLYDGLMQDDTRAGTPVDNAKPMPKRRGRPPLSSLQHDNGGDTDGSKPAPKKRGPRGRRSEVVPQDTDADTPGPAREAIAPPPAEGPTTKRRRGPQPRVAVEQDAPGEDDADGNFSDEPAAKRARTTRMTRGKPSVLLRHNSSLLDAETEEDESRPTTSSSNGTVSDAGSSYGVGTRQTKRPRNAREDADEADSSAVLQPQRKRPRINFRAHSRPYPTDSDAVLANTASSPFPPADDARIVTFWHQGGNRWRVELDGHPSRESSNLASARPSAAPSAAPSAPASTTSSAPPSQAGGDGDAKDYSTMTKSEKMSASMKKRWLNGSMQNAVNKRKATLAAKKAAAAAAAAATSAPTPPPIATYPPHHHPQRLHPFINMNGHQGGV